MNAPRQRVLVVDDERHLVEGICENLEDEGYETGMAGDGEEALSQLRAASWDLVVLDVMMPRLDGFAVCETMRREGIEVPVLFLTARGQVDDRIRGLESGADDYLAKPFHLKELLLRVAVLLRRGGPAAKRARLEFGGNMIDFDSFRATAWDGSEHGLTPKEAAILEVLADREGTVVSREAILDAVWGHDLYPSTRTIDNFILRLRRRFERDVERPRHLHTVRGVGYRFVLAGEDPT